MKKLKKGFFYYPFVEDPFYWDGEKKIYLVPDENGKWILPETQTEK